jgi:hypothetical protein
MSRKLLLWALLFVLLPTLIFAQMGKLRGLITDRDTGEPLLGANVVIEGTALGAASDLSGSYIVLAVPPGVYSVRVSYIGYQTEVMQNIRVLSALTTTQDFQLATEAVRGEALVVVAERPLIQRNTTNTVRMTVQEDIQNIPIRGLESILSVQAGVVLQDQQMHIRGGREGEVAYFIDGAPATNVLYFDEDVGVIQEAVEEIQMQSGGYTAEFGGGNSGVVNTAMRTGGSKYNVTLDYRTDDFAKSGKQFLSTSSFGYRNAVLTVSGPVPGLPKLRFFLAGQHNYMRNREPSFVEPFNTADFIDAETGLTLGALGVPLVDDGYEGREKDLPLPGDGHVRYERNSLPNSWRTDNQVQGTLMYSVTDNFKLRFTGSYEHRQQLNQSANFRDNLYYAYFNSDRLPEYTREIMLSSLRATHIINPTTFYEISAFYSGRWSQTVDPVFGHNWKAYTDSLANAEAGIDASEWRSRYLGPPWISTINNFEMEPVNNPSYSYYKNSQINMGASFDFTTQLRSRWELKAGGRVELWKMRRFSMGDIQQYMETDMSVTGENPYPWEEKYGENADYVRMVELAKASGATFIGYDIDGNKSDKDPYGPNTPMFASAYVQNKLEYKDLVLNVGVRYERIDLQALKPTDPLDPVMDTKNDWISDGTVDADGDGSLDEKGWERTGVYNYFLPRLNFSFPVTDRTVFYALYGKYIQMPKLDQVYRGYRQMSESTSPMTRTQYGWWGSYVGYTAKPEEIVQYEMGIRQSLTENFAFTITGFYKNYNNLLRLDRLYAERSTADIPEGSIVFCGYMNKDFATNKGIEMTLELRRTKRLSARVNYTMSDAKGTSADSRSGDVVVSDEVIARYPILMNPLAYNQPHRGSIMLDYRFSKGDGGRILEGIGANLLFTFNSGHAYTKIDEPRDLGQADPWDVGVRAISDERGRHPMEPLNSSYTPWNFLIDLNVNKVFYLGRLNVDLYVNVLNVLNTKNVINVYPMTGTAEDDGWLGCPFARMFYDIPQYVDFYRAVNLQNRWAYQQATRAGDDLRGLARDIYGVPRQIRLGVRLEFN